MTKPFYLQLAIYNGEIEKPAEISDSPAKTSDSQQASVEEATVDPISSRTSTSSHEDDTQSRTSITALSADTGKSSSCQVVFSWHHHSLLVSLVSSAVFFMHFRQWVAYCTQFNRCFETWVCCFKLNSRSLWNVRILKFLSFLSFLNAWNAC